MKFADTHVWLESLAVKSIVSRNLKHKVPSVRVLLRVFGFIMKWANALKIHTPHVKDSLKDFNTGSNNFMWKLAYWMTHSNGISILLSDFKAHNCQKWKSRFCTCPCHNIYRVEAVGLSLVNYTFKLLCECVWVCGGVCDYVKFGAILWKMDTVSMATKLAFTAEKILHICDLSQQKVPSLPLLVLHEFHPVSSSLFNLGRVGTVLFHSL